MSMFSQTSGSINKLRTESSRLPVLVVFQRAKHEIAEGIMPCKATPEF